MKKSTKVFLGIATIWPIIYMGLFFVGMFSLFLLLPFADDRSPRTQSIDLIQLEKKIRNGEVGVLTIRGNEITATDRVGGQKFSTYVANEETKVEIITQARSLDERGRVRVERIEEESEPPPPMGFPIAFIGLFAVHGFTILLMMGLMVFYIVHVVKSDRLDQTNRIIWIVLTCTVGMFANPVYWYMYIWREPPPLAPIVTPSPPLAGNPQASANEGSSTPSRVDESSSTPPDQSLN